MTQAFHALVLDDTLYDQALDILINVRIKSKLFNQKHRAKAAQSLEILFINFRAKYLEGNQHTLDKDRLRIPKSLKSLDF